MRRYNYDLLNHWHDIPDRQKAKQIEMIRRHYTDYSENDWVLWIVPDIFHNNQTVSVNGSIQIKKKDGSILDIPYIPRKPYPNKGIHQLSMKSGRKRLFGIPLVFKSYAELCEVADISIIWDIYENIHLNNEPFTLWFQRMLVDYHVNFEINSANPEFRFFTVRSKDHTWYTYERAVKENYPEYYNEFDTAIMIKGNVCLDDGSFVIFDDEPVIEGVFDIKNPESDDPLSESEQNIIDQLLSMDHDKEKATKLAKDVVVSCEMEHTVYYHKRSEILKAAYMADLLPSENFGFISSENLNKVNQ